MHAANYSVKVGGVLSALWLCFSTPIFADDGAKWIATRATLFSQVCLKAAPGFEDFEKLAKKAGFKNRNGELLYKPEVVTSLEQADGVCRCYMTVGAPDQTAMVEGIFKRMISDFPDDWKPKSEKGSLNDTTFVREGVKVRVLLDPAIVDGNPWIAADVIAPGACPK
jgi:hypothetical protein